MNNKIIIIIALIQASVAATALYRKDKATFIVFLGLAISNIVLYLQVK